MFLLSRGQNPTLKNLMGKEGDSETHPPARRERQLLFDYVYVHNVIVTACHTSLLFPKELSRPSVSETEEKKRCDEV